MHNLAIVDSSVIIHLLRIGKLELLKKYFKKILISEDIFQELKQGVTGLSTFEQACKSWIKIENPKNLSEISLIVKSEQVSKADASLIVLAEEKKQLIISNDYALIMIARSKNIKCWWMTTFLLRCAKEKVVTKNETKKILFQLVQVGLRINNSVYTFMLQEIEEL